jgi:acetyl esterase/lipase
VSGQQKYSLLFSSDNFIEQTRTVKSSKGEMTITYQLYQHIPYVANPVDKGFQSLNVYVPIRVDAKEVDATNSPIILDIGVGGYRSVNNSKFQRINYRAELALAAGYVVISPGCRGRDNQSLDGKYYGKAPAAIVDLKAAVRYIRYNKGIIPGDTERIVSVGCSAGGALSALLGTSGNNTLFDKYLKEIGAANVNDNIYAAACFSPITDLEHSDMAYEWMFGSVPTNSGLVNQSLSEQLQSAYTHYQSSLNLQGKDGFGTIAAHNYQDYLLEYYLFPSLSKYLSDLPSAERDKYLSNNEWITLKNNSVSFSFKDYLIHIKRMKGLPAFDDFEKKQPEPLLFGNDTINARHFTDFSIQYSSGNPSAKIDADLKMLINMMNAMYFINLENNDCALYWWLRNGTGDNHTSQTVMINLATKLQNTNKEVNTWLFWDGGHCADDDPEGFIEWIGTITKY